MLELHLAELFSSAYKGEQQPKFGRCETINRTSFACWYIVLFAAISFVRVLHLAVCFILVVYYKILSATSIGTDWRKSPFVQTFSVALWS